MVNIINKTIFNGIAGGRPTTKPKYFIMHNDAGKMTPESYINWLQGRYNSGLSGKGFAHYYINRDTIARVEDTYNATWSCANDDANANSIGYEVCEELKVSDAEFIENEKMTMRQMAEDMTYYNMTPNEKNIKFHQEFYNTSCPSRSVRLHGGLEGLRTHVIESIKHYQSLGSTVAEMLENEGNEPRGTWEHDAPRGWMYKKASGNYCTNEWHPYNGDWYYFDDTSHALEYAWLEDGGKWYYFRHGGRMVHDKELNMNQKSYYFGSDGALEWEKKYY